MKKFIFLACGILFIQTSFAQKGKKEVTIEEIWSQYLFYGNDVSGFNPLKNGETYSKLVEGNSNSDIIVYSYKTGVPTDTILLGKWLIPEGTKKQYKYDSYTLSEDENKILLPTDEEHIYRHSTVENNYVFDRKTKMTWPLSSNGKQHDATFSPDGNKVAFCRDNNLFFVNLADKTETAITTNGKKNELINGSTDWVYEEEFSFTRAFQWSPDGKKVAYIRFDESQVPEYTVQFFADLYPENYTYKYPKVGEKNSIVAVFIYDLETGKTVSVDIGSETDQYIPRIKWTKDANQLCVFRMNRWQNHLDLLIADWANVKWNESTTGKFSAAGFLSTKLMFSEENKRYIDIHDNLTFFNNNKNFIWTSEQDGFNHIYIYNTTDGSLLNQVTKGNWEVTSFYGIDESTGFIYFQSTEHSPMDRNIYRIKKDGTGKESLAADAGTNDAEFSSNYHYFLHVWSDANTPVRYTIDETGNLPVKSLEDNSVVKNLLANYKHGKKEFFNFNIADGTSLNGWMMKPADFNPKKKYPVLMFVYGGPGSQEVINKWDAFDFMYYTYLNNHGYIVVCVDNRGTGGRGEEFKKLTYLNLGKYEVEDQISAAKYLGTLKYVDKSRIGIWGWSYGAYMSSLCIEKGNDVFKMAIAVAPVIDWRFYDSIYTERYMRDNKENKKGYDDGSPINYADKIKGNFMLVHGLADDNVHYQNTATFLKALYKNNIKFTQYTFPDKNHGIYGGNTRFYLFSRMAEFTLSNL